MKPLFAMTNYVLQAQPTIAPSQVPDLDILDSYPFLKLLAALVTLGIFALGGFGWLRAERLGRVQHQQQQAQQQRTMQNDTPVQMFFDGPLKAIFDNLNTLIANQQINKLETKDTLAQLLSTHRHTVLSALQEVQAEITQVINNAAREDRARSDDVWRQIVVKLDETAREVRELRELLVKDVAERKAREQFNRPRR